MKLLKGVILSLGVLASYGAHARSAFGAEGPIDRFVGTFTGGQCAEATGVPDISGLFCVLVNAINYLLSIGGAVALIMLVVGGLQYMVSGGDEKAITAAKSTVSHAVLGLLIIFGAILIVNTVLTGIGA